MTRHPGDPVQRVTAVVAFPTCDFPVYPLLFSPPGCSSGGWVGVAAAVPLSVTPGGRWTYQALESRDWAGWSSSFVKVSGQGGVSSAGSRGGSASGGVESPGLGRLRRGRSCHWAWIVSQMAIAVDAAAYAAPSRADQMALNAHLRLSASRARESSGKAGPSWALSVGGAPKYGRNSGTITSRRATSCCAAQPLTIRRMRQRITAASARTHPSPGIHACRRRSARVPRSVWLEHLSRARRRDWLQAIGAW